MLIMFNCMGFAGIFSRKEPEVSIGFNLLCPHGTTAQSSIGVGRDQHRGPNIFDKFVELFDALGIRGFCGRHRHPSC
ncbi:hypothetical protein D3C87_2083140 [compost metagenome]